MGDDTEGQRTHFEDERNQYSRDQLLTPPPHTAAEQASLIDALVGLDRSRPIIDFGAGTGRVSIALARAGYPVIAVDVSPASLAALEATAAALGIGGIRTSLTLPAMPAQAIVGADVLHHVSLDRTLPGLFAALEPGGRLVFSEPGGGHPFWYAYQSARRAMWIERRIVTINRVWLPRKLRQAGFTEIAMRGAGLLPRPIGNMHPAVLRLNDAAGNWPVVRWCAYRYLITARRLA